MKAVLKGLRNHDVVLMRGDSTRRDLVQEFVQNRFECTVFSAVNMNISRITTSLQSRRWDGVCPVIVFYRCEQWMRELVPLIRKRQSKQAVLLVSDGVYTPQTSLMKSLVTGVVVCGRLEPTVFSALKTVKSRPMEHDPEETQHPTRYQVAIACSDLDAVIDQIHHVTAPSLEDACDRADALSDIDSLRYMVPDEMTSHCLPYIPSITYQTQTKIRKRLMDNHDFAKTLPSLVAKTTKTLLGLHPTLDYIRFAHQIALTPQIAQCPRDDTDALWVTNVNDKIRVLVCLLPEMSSTESPTLDHPSELKRLQTLAARYKSKCPVVVPMISKKRKSVACMV